MARVCVPAGALPRGTDRRTRGGSQEAAKGCGSPFLALAPSLPAPPGMASGMGWVFLGWVLWGYIAVPTVALETEPQLACGGRSGASGAFSSFSLLSLCLSLLPRCAFTGGSRNSSPREESTRRQGCCQPQHPRGQQGWEAGSRGGTEGTEGTEGFLWRRVELAQLINVTFTPSSPCRAARGKSPLWPAPRGRMGPPKGEGQLLGSPNPALSEQSPPSVRFGGRNGFWGWHRMPFVVVVALKGKAFSELVILKLFFLFCFKKMI